MFRGSANDPCLPNAYKVKLIREIWGVRCTAARNVDESASHAPHSPLHTPCDRYVNLGKMSPKRRGAELDTYHCEYIVYGDFERDAPYSFNTTAYWVTLSKMVEDVKKKKAEEEGRGRDRDIRGQPRDGPQGRDRRAPVGQRERGGGRRAVILLRYSRGCSLYTSC